MSKYLWHSEILITRDISEQIYRHQIIKIPNF